ncbi:MAG: hypothetical protein GY777_09240 [Candidatus Brocadiaceae bacterium]|nr:hypothetical protein [Candidatus Brocadiaceae bacterium]
MSDFKICHWPKADSLLRAGRQGRKDHNEKQRLKQKKDNKEARKSGVTKTFSCIPGFLIVRWVERSKPIYNLTNIDFAPFTVNSYYAYL